MANAAGHYHAQGGRPQFPSYASSTTTSGHYYQQSQQRHQQPSGFQYYAPPPPQPPAPPGAGRYGGTTTTQQSLGGSLLTRNQPPPPPPPPGESSASSLGKNITVSNSFNNASNKQSSSIAASLTSSHGGYNYPPLQPPPLPPMFPWMSAALAESMTSSRFGQSFREEASNLPFVPIIVNDADLAKMTENVIKEAEQVKSHQLQYYKDVVNQDLPQSLKDLFQPLYCKLCTLTLSSPVVAKDHYIGKRHKKAVEGWFLKNPQLCETKLKKEASRSQGPSHPPQPISGTIVKTPGGGLGLTGPINGYVTQQGPSTTQSKPTPPAPPSLFSMNFDNNRKRPAPSPPAIGVPVPTPTSSVNTQQQKKVNCNSSSGNGPQKTTQIPPSVSPQLVAAVQQAQAKTPLSITATTTAPLVVANIGAKTNLTGPPVNQNQNQGQGSSGKTPEVSNINDANFQAKRPRRDRDDSETLRTSDLDRAQRPLGAPPQQQQRGSGAGGGPPPTKMCDICNVQLSSKVMAEQHFKGKNHQARLAAIQEGGTPGVVTPSSIAGGRESVDTTNIPNSSNISGIANSNPTPKADNSIVNKLLALSSQSSAQIPPPDMGGDSLSFFGGEEAAGVNPFNPNQHLNKSRGGGGGHGRGGGNNGPGGRGGGGGGFGGRGGGHQNNNRGGGRGGGGPPFRSNNFSNNNNNRNNNNNFNNKNRFNNNNSNNARGRR